MATEDLEVIVNRICEYTRKLAQDNQVDLTRDEMHAGDKQDRALVYQNAIKPIQSIQEMPFCWGRFCRIYLLYFGQFGT